MYFPLVGERVWLGGCSHEFTVVRTDYTACVAAVSPVEDKTQIRVCHFREVFPYDEYEAAQTRQSLHNTLTDLLRSSRSLMNAGKAAIYEMRKTAIESESTVKKSQELIDRSDKVIERWKSLGCKP